MLNTYVTSITSDHNFATYMSALRRKKCSEHNINIIRSLFATCASISYDIRDTQLIHNINKVRTLFFMTCVSTSYNVRDAHSIHNINKVRSLFFRHERKWSYERLGDMNERASDRLAGTYPFAR